MDLKNVYSLILTLPYGTNHVKNYKDYLQVLMAYLIHCFVAVIFRKSIKTPVT